MSTTLACYAPNDGDQWYVHYMSLVHRFCRRMRYLRRLAVTVLPKWAMFQQLDTFRRHNDDEFRQCQALETLLCERSREFIECTIDVGLLKGNVPLMTSEDVYSSMHFAETAWNRYLCESSKKISLLRSMTVVRKQEVPERLLELYEEHFVVYEKGISSLSGFEMPLPDTWDEMRALLRLEHGTYYLQRAG